MPSAPTVSHTGDGNEYRLQNKYTASGPVRRGRPLTSQTAFGGQLPYKGSLVRPVARFHHSLFEYNGRLLRAMNHEPRAICRVSGYTQDSLRDALFRTSPTIAPIGAFLYEPRVTRGDRRSAGPLGSRLDERRTAYDERFVKEGQ